MDKDTIKKMIAEIVSSVNGCKSTELPVHIAQYMDAELRRAIFDSKFEFPDLIAEMVGEGLLVQVGYVLPYMDYKEKTFLILNLLN